jgi:isopenicillin-N epimerase
MPDPFWAAARERMLLDQTVTNLNTGSFGPLSRPVFERVTELRRLLAAEPMNFFVRQLPPLLWEARCRLAQFIGGVPERLVFTENVTTAINLVASSLSIASPGEILLTDHEYGAMHWTWERAAQRLGLSMRTFPLPVMPDSPNEVVAAAVAAMTDRTRLFFFSHVLSPTGMVLPARELCAEAHKRGIITVVDGAHAPAFVPLNVSEIDADFYGANGHKWLLAPSGCGFLYYARRMEDRLMPLQVSWGWRPDRNRKPDEPDEFGTTPRLRFLEFEGTRDVCPWLAIPAAIDFQAEIGFERIRGRVAELTAHVRKRLTGLAGLRLTTPAHPEMHGALTAFRLPAGLDPATLRRRLWEEYRIEAPIVERPDCFLIRTSTHFYNTEEEVDRLAQALPRLLA